MGESRSMVALRSAAVAAWLPCAVPPSPTGQPEGQVRGDPRPEWPLGATSGCVWAGARSQTLRHAPTTPGRYPTDAGQVSFFLESIFTD